MACGEVQVLVCHRGGKGQEGVGASKDSAAVLPHQRSLDINVLHDAHQRTATVDLNARRADAAAYLVALVELVDSALIVGLDGRQTGGHGQRVGAECASPRDLRTALGVKCGHDVGASSKGADRGRPPPISLPNVARSGVMP